MIIFIIVVLILLALAIYGIMNYLPMIGSPFKELICLLLIVIAIIVIAQRAGLMGAIP
jgi:hypothetical protein